MEIVFIAGVATITSDSTASEALYRAGLGLPLEGDANDYIHSGAVEGLKHFGVWPLAMAAQVCFGSNTWPADLPVPQVTIEFELASVEAVRAAVSELQDQGHTFIHEAIEQPWGQTVARMLSPEHALIGLTYTPWMH